MMSNAIVSDNMESDDLKIEKVNDCQEYCATLLIRDAILYYFYNNYNESLYIPPNNYHTRLFDYWIALAVQKNDPNRHHYDLLYVVQSVTEESIRDR